jgi:hypothetical protein
MRDVPSNSEPEWVVQRDIASMEQDKIEQYMDAMAVDFAESSEMMETDGSPVRFKYGAD